MRKTLFTASALALALAAPSPRLSKPGTSSFALVRLPLIRVRIAVTSKLAAQHCRYWRNPE